MKSIYDMMGRHTYPLLREEEPLEHVERFFQVSAPTRRRRAPAPKGSWSRNPWASHYPRWAAPSHQEVKLSSPTQLWSGLSSELKCHPHFLSRAGILVSSMSSPSSPRKLSVRGVGLG